MWKDLDPSKITSSVCLKCGVCCKHTSRYYESTERYAKRKVEYLIAMLGKPESDFEIISPDKNNSNKWLKKITFNCVQLNSDNTCKIYENRPEICREYNCFVTANLNKLLPENYENIEKYVG